MEIQNLGHMRYCRSKQLVESSYSMYKSIIRFVCIRGRGRGGGVINGTIFTSSSERGFPEGFSSDFFGM